MSYSLYRDRITVSRRTATLLASTTTATPMSLTTQPNTPAHLQVKISAGTTNVGTVAIAGTDEDGAALALTLTYGGTRSFEQTPKPFASVDASGIVPSAALVADAGTIEVRAVGASGSPMGDQRTTVATNWPCHIDHERAGWPRGTQGAQQTEQAWIGIPHTTAWTPQAGDEAVDQYGNRYELQGRPKWRGSAGDHHWECPVAQREVS